MLNPASGAVGRAGLKNYMYNTMYQCKVRDSVSVILSTRNGFSDENNLPKKRYSMLLFEHVSEWYWRYIYQIQRKTERIQKKNTPTYQETDWTTHLVLIKSAFYLYNYVRTE